MNQKALCLSILLCFCFLFGMSQDKPKIGLVLSGGGAKGMAHIGVLKELEALGITPDYITGTSMGSIVGGLYAAGYNAHEIEQIALSMNWEALLSNQVSLDKILFEEKYYYQRYLIELGVDKFSIQLPKGLIEGQMLSELLSSLTRHVHDIDDFNNLPIPFACVGTDIVTGEPVVMRNGSLASALRASMAIPSVFTPILRDGHYMVDGGLVRNFPVQECLDMGADIIIGVFVSDDLLPQEKLASAVDVLTQSAFVMSVFDSREQKTKCDLLIEPVMGPYSTFSFEATQPIIDIGQEAAKKVRPELKALADSLNFTPGSSITRPAIRDTFLIKKIEIRNNENIPSELIKSRLKIKEDSLISISKLQDRIEALYGTRYFDKVSYALAKDDDGYALILTTDEAIPRQLKLGLHYDTENGAGFNVNLTARDLMPASRAVLEVDISESFRLDVNFLKYLKSTQSWAVKAGVNYRNSEVPIGIGNIQEGIFNNSYFNPYISLFTTARRNYTSGFAFQYENSRLKPKVAGEELRTFDKLSWQSFSGTLFFAYNSMNRQFFPTEGSAYNLSGKYSFGIDYDLNIRDSLQVTTIETDPESFFSLNLHHHNRWAISHRFTLGVQNALIMNFIQRDEDDLTDFFPYYNDQVFTGGYRPLLKNTLPFWGTDQLAFLTDHLLYSELLIQYKMLSNIYFEAASQYMNSLYPMQWFYKEAENGNYEFYEGTNSIWGYGFKLSYMSLIGPVTLGIASHTKTASWNPFFSVGFYF